MKVRELIEFLSTCDPEAECYRGSFDGFLTADMKYTSTITDKESHTVYNLEVEEKTVYDLSARTGRWIEYKGVIFE